MVSNITFECIGRHCVTKLNTILIGVQTDHIMRWYHAYEISYHITYVYLLYARHIMYLLESIWTTPTIRESTAAAPKTTKMPPSCWGPSPSLTIRDAWIFKFHTCYLVAWSSQLFVSPHHLFSSSCNLEKKNKRMLLLVNYWPPSPSPSISLYYISLFSGLWNIYDIDDQQRNLNINNHPICTLCNKHLFRK